MQMTRTDEIREEMVFLGVQEEDVGGAILIAGERIGEAIENLAGAVYDLSHTLATPEVGNALRGLEKLPEAVMAVADIARAIDVK